MNNESSLPRLLFRVTEVWELSGQSLQVTSDIEDVRGYKVGDEVELRRADGTRLRVRSGLVHVNKDWKIAVSEPDRKWPLIFWLEGISKEEVPIGTEVWMLTEHPAVRSKGMMRFEKIQDAGS
jgi:hypothetical protein